MVDPVHAVESDMALEQTWRWFGPHDPVTLQEVRQTGATGIVSALHHIPIGEIWPVDEILKRKEMIESYGLSWSVIESVPVHEDIKKMSGQYRRFIDNYKTTLRNIGQCGMDTVCYNFMPVLDWSRTDLQAVGPDESVGTRFESKAFAAFDLFLLDRQEAATDYTPDQIREAKNYFEGLTADQKSRLTDTMLLGLPGSLEAYTLDQFRAAITAYAGIGEKELRTNLSAFIKEIIPVAEEAGVLMAIHPDDPPWSLLGLPRVVRNQDDIDHILKVVNSPSNGFTLCTGSLGASIRNDLATFADRFADRISFVHLRNVTPSENGDFEEAYHLNGTVDVYHIVKTLLLEQKRRRETGRKDFRMPMRPDHGHLMIPEREKSGIYPGYSLFGRMRGLAEIRGLEMAIRRSLDL
jgi:mannonate dehydratase